MKIVVKLGTQSILSATGEPIIEIMAGIVKQIVRIQQEGHQVVLVSSGAVGFGRSIARQKLRKEYGTTIGEKQLLASFGQHELMHIYANMFMEHEFLISQILLTKQDFYTRQHYLNIARLIREILSHHYIIPIINENDSVAIEELMFTDNDELAGLIAAQINAEKLILLSNVKGVYAGNFSAPDAEVITTIDPNTGWPTIENTKSTHGRGGMVSKLANAKKMSKLGITTHIASINESHVIGRIVAGEMIGTTILGFQKKSNIKKWVAYGLPNGKIMINRCLHEILKDHNRVVSILPVGIESFLGEFNKGDIVEILSPDHEVVGIGMVKYDSKKLFEMIGQKEKPELIHYDYLYVY